MKLTVNEVSLLILVFDLQRFAVNKYVICGKKTQKTVLFLL